MSEQRDVSQRRERLRALRNRYQNAAPTVDSGAALDAGDATGGGADQAPAGGKGALMQRLIQFLGQPVPGGRLIPGTNIYEARIQQALNFLRQRAEAAGGGGRGARFQKALDLLTQSRPGDHMAGGVNVTRLQQLLGGARRRGAAAPALPAAPAAGEGELPSRNVQEMLEQLVDVTQRLSRDLEETRAQVNRIMQERGGARADDVDEPEQEQEEEEGLDRKRAGQDWFNEFLG